MSADAGLWRTSSGGQNPFRRSLRGSRQRPEKPMQGGRKWRLASRDLVTRTVQRATPAEALRRSGCQPLSPESVERSALLAGDTAAEGAPWRRRQDSSKLPFRVHTSEAPYVPARSDKCQDSGARKRGQGRVSDEQRE